MKLLGGNTFRSKIILILHSSFLSQTGLENSILERLHNRINFVSEFGRVWSVMCCWRDFKSDLCQTVRR
jgi:hypothetical protein